MLAGYIKKEEEIMVIWDWLNNLYHKNYRYPSAKEVQKELWMINKFLSFDPNLTEVVATTSKYMFCLKERYYRLMYRIIPESNPTRVLNAKMKVEFDKDLVGRYANMYGLSRRESVDYLKILTKKNKLKEVYEFVGLEVKK